MFPFHQNRTCIGLPPALWSSFSELWGAVSRAIVITLKVKVTQSCLTLCDPVAYTVHEFSRPEYWSG